MTWHPADLDQMQWLLGKHQVEGLDTSEEFALRSLVAKRYPAEARDFALPRLIRYAHIIVGAERALRPYLDSLDAPASSA